MLLVITLENNYFAQTTPHAKFIVDRFNDLYPQYGGEFCRYVTYKEDYSDNLIEKFKDPEGEPTIIVSIDMMDTGVDVPEVVNLVFFKQVKSKIKFTQMIGRGTRKCPNLLVTVEIRNVSISLIILVILSSSDRIRTVKNLM